MATCFLCGMEMVPRFEIRDHLRPGVPTQFQLEWCAGCALGRIAGQFTPDQVADFYTADYYTHVAHGQNGHAQPRLLDRLRMHLAWRTDRGVDLTPQEVPRSSNAPSLCDVGCGSGQIMAAFKAAGFQTVGIEPDPAARKLAQAVGPVHEGTAEALPNQIAASRFDVVLLSHVLEHCIDPAAALANVKGLLAPGGTAVIEVPNNAAMGLDLYGPGWFFADIPRHLQFFTEKSLRAALRQTGLRVSRVIYTGYTRQFSPQWLAAQQQIRLRTGLNGPARPSQGAWSLLAKTAFAAPAHKYDSIRVHAVQDNQA